MRVTSDDHPPGERPLGAHQADEEDVRFLTSFNDVFVTLAIFLVLVALAWFGGRVSRLLAGTAVAAASWLLAEFFIRRRRMALPSIVLVLSFTGGMFAVGLGLAQSAGLTAESYVIYAMAVLFRAAGSLNASLALTALIVGGLLLVLSAFWRPIRRAVLRIMPALLRDRVPLT